MHTMSGSRNASSIMFQAGIEQYCTQLEESSHSAVTVHSKNSIGIMKKFKATYFSSRRHS